MKEPDQNSMQLRNNRPILVGHLLFLFVLIQTQAAFAQENTWTPNFRETDIIEVIRAVQDATGKTFMIDPRVRGSVTVISTEPVDTEGYYSIFLRALDLNGFTAIETDTGLVSIVPSQEARSGALPFPDSDRIDNNAYVTQLIEVQNIPVDQLLPVLRPLVSQGNGQLSSFPQRNLLLLVDTWANVQRILELVASIDTLAEPVTEFVELEYSQAREILPVLQALLSQAVTADTVEVSQVKVIADDRTNSIIVSGSLTQRERVRELVLQLDRPKVQDGNTRVIYLEYATAANVAEVLRSVVTSMAGGSPEPGTGSSATIEADAQSNSLIITADLDTVNTLMAVIQRLDIQRAQILVEAILVEINDDVGRNLGIQWLFRNDDGGFGGSFGEGNNPLVLGGIADSAFNSDRAGALVDLGTALAREAGQTIGIGRLGGSTDLLALIDMLQATSGANILSTPNLMTTDNTEAVISVGESVPFITGSFTNTGGSGNAINPFQTISRENVGTTLRVTPHVNRGDRVALDIIQEISSISQRVGAVDLITNERRIETRVTVADGEIVVLGGLMRDDVLQSESRIPLLGSIPGLGQLFRSQSTKVQKTNLLVFIRPTIMRDDADLRGATAEKYNLIRDRQLLQRSLPNMLIDEEILPLLPDWETQSGKPDSQGVSSDQQVDDGSVPLQIPD